MRFVNKLLRVISVFLGKKSKEEIQKFRNISQVEAHLNLQFRDSTDIAG